MTKPKKRTRLSLLSLPVAHLFLSTQIPGALPPLAKRKAFPTFPITEAPNPNAPTSRINWQPYFEYIIECVKTGKTIDKDWIAGLGDTLYNGSVCLAELGKKATVEGTEAKLQAVAAKLKNGELRVFDTSKFTINNNVYDDVTTETYFPALTAVKKSDDGKLVSAKQNGVEVVKTEKGITYFDESNTKTNRSAPYFDIDIDGIEVVA